ncbi:IclR family transcriptional regulator [Clostridium swellfunianum]|uniref:IclR family transcriptional regulator n=1 Tax=Clostridium swellfunianum TaxID=1367462 RepID=UPI00202DCD66|nr:IclR family transcriptional regulator [Clostridium swellfunianum]MCM0651022.1 IclR family transcriptional regulator [Clostridium swellfunianum]
MSGENSVQSVDRALDILEFLAGEKRSCGVTEIGNAVGLHKSTVHRLLGTLMNKGYIEKDIDSDNYTVGKKVLFLASSVLDRMDVRTVARPYIRRLSERTNEVVHLSILDGDEAVYIDKVESLRQGSVRMHSQIGKRVPLYCTAVGKVLLSSEEDEKVKELLKHKEMYKFTRSTIDNVDNFIEELHKVRKAGYSTDEMEHEEGIRCVAAPIHDRKGKIIAAVSISGPIFYMTEDRLPEVKSELLQAAEEISNQLGYFK